MTITRKAVTPAGASSLSPESAVTPLSAPPVVAAPRGSALERRALEAAALAAKNRAQMPLTAAVMDEFRAIFGPGCRLVHAVEGSEVRGAPGPEGVQATDNRRSVERKKRDRAGEAVAAMKQRSLIGEGA